MRTKSSFNVTWPRISSRPGYRNSMDIVGYSPCQQVNAIETFDLSDDYFQAQDVRMRDSELNIFRNLSAFTRVTACTLALSLYIVTR